MARLAGGAGHSMGVCLLTVLLGGLSGQGNRFSQVTAQLNIQSGYVGDNLAKAKLDTSTLNCLHD